MSHPVRLHALQDEVKMAEARRVRSRMFELVRKASEMIGNEIAGYALVVWAKDGEMQSSYDANNGPIRYSLVPTLVSDALNRHIAVMMAEERVTSRSMS